MGQIIFAIGLAVFGFLHILTAVTGTGVGPPWVPGAAVLSVVAGIALLVAAAAVVRDRRAGSVVGALLVAYAAAVWGPPLLGDIGNGRIETPFFELVAFGAAAWVLAGGRLVLPGRILFAVSLAVFASLHFRFAEFIATLIPDWMPARLFLSIAVGVGFAAAALAIAVGVLGRLAALVLGIMFSIWVVVLHAPRAIAALGDPNEMTSLFVAFTMAGAAFVVARGFAPGPEALP